MQDREITQTRKKMSVYIANNKFAELRTLLLALGKKNVTAVLNKNAQGSVLPLINACDWGSPEAVNLYLEHGADVNAKTTKDETPLDQAFHHIEAASEQSVRARMQCAKIMLQHNIARKKQLQHMNLFLFFLLRLRRIAPTVEKFNVNYFSLWMETLQELEQPLQYISDHGGEQFIDYAEELVRSKHILGLDMEASINIKGLHSNLQPGNQTVFSRYYLHEILSEYIATVALPVSVRQNFKFILKALEQNNPDIQIIAAGWTQHDLYVAKMDDKLILCNRGERSDDQWGGVKIYKLRDPKIDIADSLKYVEDAKVFEAQLQAIVDSNMPIENFEHIQEQKHGTCSFVNAKTLLAPLLYALEDEDYYGNYKQLTTWMRDRELEHLLAKFKQARLTRNKANRLFYFEILMKYAIKLEFMTLKKAPDEKLIQDKARLEQIQSAFAEFGIGKTFVAWLKQAKPKELEKEYFVPLQINGTGKKPVGNISVKYVGKIGDLNFTKFHCDDHDLRDYILDNIRQRKLDIAMQIDAAEHMTDEEEFAAAEDKIKQEISGLQADWERFLHATGQEQIVDVSKSYIERRKSLMVTSSIFSTSDENVALHGLENLLAKKFNR